MIEQPTDTFSSTFRKIILDTSNFIKLKSLSSECKYYTNSFIINEIRDEHARDFYNLNKEFIEIKNPSRESMKHITSFAKLSNDLGNLSIPDISIIALAYDLIKIEGYESTLRKEPFKLKIVEKINSSVGSGSSNPKTKTVPEVDDEGFTVFKSKNKMPITEEEDHYDSEEWITESNMNVKLNNICEYDDLNGLNTNSKDDMQNPPNIFISSSDFTVQNLALKIGIPIMNIDGLIIKKIKNYILKCYSCYNFLYDTTKQFCDECGYTTLMKIGCSVTNDGRFTIFDKPAQARNRGTQYDLPKPSLNKKAAVYILSEDQLPKRRTTDVEKDLDKILNNYEDFKDFKSVKFSDTKIQNTSKNFIWGYPKKNPNIPKKSYGKKQKK